jgi:hypothetical protein
MKEAVEYLNVVSRVLSAVHWRSYLIVITILLLFSFTNKEIEMQRNQATSLSSLSS